MHDTVQMEKRGVPAVALIHDRFDAAAGSQARMLGLAGAKVVSVPEPLPGESPEESPLRIDNVLVEIVEGLTGKSGP